MQDKWLITDSSVTRCREGSSSILPLRPSAWSCRRRPSLRSRLTQPPRSGCRCSSTSICTSKVSSKYQNTFFGSNFNMSKYRLYRDRFWWARSHFSAFFKIIQKNKPEIAEKARNRKQPWHQNFEIFWKFVKIVVFWYSTSILYFDTLLVFCIFTLKFLKICSQQVTESGRRP